MPATPRYRPGATSPSNAIGRSAGPVPVGQDRLAREVDDALKRRRMRVAAAEALAEATVALAWYELKQSAPDNQTVAWLYARATRRR